MSRTYRRLGAPHLCADVIDTAVQRRRHDLTHPLFYKERQPDPHAPDLVAAVRRLHMDVRSHRWSNPPQAHRQPENRRLRQQLRTELGRALQRDQEPTPLRHRNSAQRLWDWY